MVRSESHVLTIADQLSYSRQPSPIAQPLSLFHHKKQIYTTNVLTPGHIYDRISWHRMMALTTPAIIERKGKIERFDDLKKEEFERNFSFQY